MKRFLLCALLLLFASNSFAFHSAQIGSPTESASADAGYDLASFTAELHRLSDILGRNPPTQEMAAVRDSLPREWKVTTPDRTYSISTEFLRDKLTAGSAEMAKVWVDHVAMEADSHSAS